MRGYIQAVLKECDDLRRGHEYMMEYKDTEYEVYSYSDGDGIWGTYFDDLEAVKEELGEKILNRWIEQSEDFEEFGILDEVKIEVPFSFVEKQGFSILNKKKRRPIQISTEDMGHMVSEGVVHNPDGNDVELDSEESPIFQAGMI